MCFVLNALRVVLGYLLKDLFNLLLLHCPCTFSVAGSPSSPAIRIIAIFKLVREDHIMLRLVELLVWHLLLELKVSLSITMISRCLSLSHCDWIILTHHCCCIFTCLHSCDQILILVSCCLLLVRSLGKRTFMPLEVEVSFLGFQVLFSSRRF